MRANPAAIEPANLTRESAAAMLKSIVMESNRDKRHALQRVVTKFCPSLDPKNAKHGQPCDHQQCWHTSGVSDMSQRIALCEMLGVDINAVLGVNPSIQFRTEKRA